MKVMHILNSATYSGAENVVITIINALKEMVDSVYVSRKGSISDVLKENEIENYLVEKLSISELKEVIEKSKPDIIHAHDFTASIMASLVAKKIPVISHIHNNPPWIKKVCLKSIAYAVSCFKYEQIFTVSNSVMEEFIFGKYVSEKTQVIGNPVQIVKIREKAAQEQWLKEYDIAFLGRLSTPKNPQMFVEVINELRKMNPSIKAVMIGDGELRNKIQKKIDLYGLNNSIELLGFQKNPYIILKESKLLCMPSEWEGFGLAAVEALALGKPVIACPVGGLVDIIDNSCGYLCKTKIEMIQKINELLTNDELYEKKSLNALKRAEKLDNYKQYTDKIKKIYLVQYGKR